MKIKSLSLFSIILIVNVIKNVLMVDLANYENTFKRFYYNSQAISTILSNKQIVTSFYDAKTDTKCLKICIQSTVCKSAIIGDFISGNCLLLKYSPKFEFSSIKTQWKIYIRTDQFQTFEKPRSPVYELSHGGEISRLKMLDNGNLASCSWYPSIKLWDLSKRSLIQTHTISGACYGGLEQINSTTLAYGSSDVVYLLQFAGPASLSQSQIRFTGYTVLSLKLVKSNILAIGLTYGEIRFLDTTSFAIQKIKADTFGGVNTMALLDSNTLAVGYSSITVGVSLDIINLADYTVKINLKKKDDIFKIFNLNDKTLISSIYEPLAIKNLFIWNTENGSYYQFSKQNCEIKSFAQLNNGFLVNGCDSLINIWNIETQTKVEEIQANLVISDALELLSNGFLASGSWDGKIKIWNLDDL